MQLREAITIEIIQYTLFLAWHGSVLCSVLCIYGRFGVMRDGTIYWRLY